MMYSDKLDEFRDSMSPDEFMKLLCSEAHFDLCSAFDFAVERNVEDYRKFMYLVVMYADYMKELLKQHTPPAWGEDY